MIRSVLLVTDGATLVQPYTVQEDCVLVSAQGSGALTTDPAGFDCDSFGTVAGVFENVIVFLFSGQEGPQLSFPLRAGERIFFGNGTGSGSAQLFLQTADLSAETPG
jgi:hypothetical protein